MITIMLVDDEVLAMEYLKNIMDWNAYGYQIAGCASSGKRALEMYDRIWPDIVISDIRMPGMDGIELTKRLKEKNPDVIVVLLSAYKDFEYAQKGIRCGVCNYLLKHELGEETLVWELGRIREQLKKESRKEKIYQNYFVNRLIHNQTEDMEDVRLGHRLFLILLHKSNRFIQGEFKEEEWQYTEQEVLRKAAEQGIEDKVSYVTEVQLTTGNRLMLYRIENTTSKYTVNRLIEQKSGQIADGLRRIPECRFNLLYSYEIGQEEISRAFQMMSRQIRYAAFWEQNKCYPLDSCMQEEERIVWGEEILQLRKAVYGEGGETKELLESFFRGLTYPRYKLEASKALIQLLDNLNREIREQEGIAFTVPQENLYTVDEVKAYYQAQFAELSVWIGKESKNCSKQVQEMIRFIRKHYNQELSLEILGQEFQMNGVYLGQIFKKEMGTTFLKYLTQVRMDEAKRLLQTENLSVAEAAERVGYQTSQYFSRIFTKTVGVNPQEYRKWQEKK